MNYAHLIRESSGYMLALTPTIRPVDAVKVVAVKGKVQARKVAAEHGAKPWNF